MGGYEVILHGCVYDTFCLIRYAMLCTYIYHSHWYGWTMTVLKNVVAVLIWGYDNAMSLIVLNWN